MIKWIGEHIWDFVSRFRNDIYMESIPDGTIASGKNLGLDSNNKVVKSSSPSGSIDLTSEVTGTLPVANGGTGATSLNNLITLSTHTTGDYVASLTAGSLIDLQNNTGEGATPTIDVDLSELTDMTESWTTAEDEFVVLDNGTQKRKLSSEIFGSNAFTSTTILDTEAVQDVVGGMFSSNTETLCTVTYEDGDGTIDIVVDNDLSNYDNSSSGFITSTLTNEQVQDIVGGMFSGNTETLCTVTYQDGDGTIDVVVDNDLSNYDNSSSGFITSTLTTEQVQDIVGGMFSGNTETRISATYQDGDGTIDLVADDMTANTMGSGFTVSATTDTTATTITEGDDLFFAAGTGITCETTADGTVTITNTVSDTNTQLSDEQVQDIVGGMFSGNTETLCTVTYQDSDGTIDLVVDNDLSNYDNSSSGFITATLTTEQVQDIVGGMFSGNTETRISATYQDGDGTIDLAVDDMTANDNTTYSISCVDGDNSDEEKIRLTDSGGTTDDVVLEAGTGLSIARSSDKITFTNTVTASTDVTLAGTPDYITISGQEITRNQIDLAADVTGVLPSANLDSDTAHLSGSQTFTGTKTFNHIRHMVLEHSDPGTGVGDFKAADVAFFGSTTGMTTGKCYYLNDSGGWTITNADAEADASGLLAIALGDESDVDGMLLRGMVTPFALAGTDDYGKKVYLREQDGVLTTSIPTTSGSIVRIVGYMLHDSDDAIFFCPDNTYVELA